MAFVPSEWEAAVCGADTLHIRYAPGELICQHGCYVAGVHLILSGIVAESVPLPDGGSGRPEVLGAGDLLGIEVLAEPASETSTSACAAVTDVRLLFFERRAFHEQLLRTPALASRMLRYMALRHVKSQERARIVTDTELLSELLLRLETLCGASGKSEPAVLPAVIAPRTLQELSALTGRRFRNAWEAIDSLEFDDGRIVFDRDAVSLQRSDSRCAAS